MEYELPSRRVFIAPGSMEHINKSVISQEEIVEDGLPKSISGALSLDKIRDKLSPEERIRLEELYPHGRIRLWGTKKSNKGHWDKIREDDVIIFYSKGHYIGDSNVRYTT